MHHIPMKICSLTDILVRPSIDTAVEITPGASPSHQADDVLQSSRGQNYLPHSWWVPDYHTKYLSRSWSPVRTPPLTAGRIWVQLLPKDSHGVEHSSPRTRSCCRYSHLHSRPTRAVHISTDVLHSTMESIPAPPTRQHQLCVGSRTCLLDSGSLFSTWF